MKKQLLGGFLIAGLVITGCSSHTASPSAQEAGPGEIKKHNVDQFIKNGLGFKLGRSRAKIIANLGEPRNTIVEKANTPSTLSTYSSAGIADETYELFYDGLVVGLYHAAVEKEDLLQHLSITDSKYKIKWGLGIGCTKQKVKSVLGNPSEEDEFAYVYKNSHGTESFVHFYFANDVVYKIDWWYYQD